MTELETLFYKDFPTLRRDIEEAIAEEDTNALANYRREFSFKHEFYAEVSIPSMQEGVLTLESKEEMDAVVNGEWEWDEEKYDDRNDEYDYDSYECNDSGVNAFPIELLNPSPEAQGMLRKREQDKLRQQTTRQLGVAVRSLVRGTKGAENWSDEQVWQFVQENTEELTKALVALN